MIQGTDGTAWNRERQDESAHRAFIRRGPGGRAGRGRDPEITPGSGYGIGRWTPGIRWMAALVLGLLWVAPGFAQGFCAHPRTPVEVTICTHPKLRSLDATLNRVYRAASRALGQTGATYRLDEKRIWATELNLVAPTDVAGLESLYRSQIREERYLLRCAPYHIAPASPPPPPPKVVPHYPDVWDYRPPPGERLYGWVLLPDGDVGIKLLNDKTSRFSYRRLFFHKPLTEADVCRIRQNAGGVIPSPTFLPHGHMLVPLPAAGHGICYSDLGNNTAIFARHSARSPVLMRKTLLYVHQTPQRMVSGCPHEGSFMVHVSSLAPLSYLMLPDGTLLAEVGLFAPASTIYPRPFLLRLTEHLHTRSPLLNKRLFIVKTADLRRWTDEYGHDDCDSQWGSHLCRMQRNLYHRLMNLEHDPRHLDTRPSGP